MAVKKTSVDDLAKKVAAATAPKAEVKNVAEPKVEKKVEAKAEAPKAEAPKADAPKAEVKKAPAKKAAPAKKETAKAEKKAPAKKEAAKAEKKAAPAKKAPAKKAEPKVELHIQYQGGDVNMSDIEARVIEDLGGKKPTQLNIYYQPENGMVYYTANDVKGEIHY